MSDLTNEDILVLLSKLNYNMDNLDKTYYDMFYNTIPMDITLKRYDELGVLRTYQVPNRAKDKTSILTGITDPEGVTVADVGTLYLNTLTLNLFYKSSGSNDSFGWLSVLTPSNFRPGVEYLAPNGDGHLLTNLDVNSVNTGTLSGLLKADLQTQKIAQAVPNVDYSTIPLGSVLPYSASIAPSADWHLANGAAISRIDYADYFELVGTTYGIGDGSTTFNIPNLMSNRFMEFSSTPGIYKNAGLPNLKGSLRDSPTYPAQAPAKVSGVFSRGDYGWTASVTGYTSWNAYAAVFNAATYSSVYQDDCTTVQPKSLTLTAIVKIR